MTRFHDLDALRAGAMLLGIVLHGTLFLLPDTIWPVQLGYAYEVEPARNPYVWLLLLIHGMRMPLFFMLSGFFTAMLWQSRGLRRLAEHRLKRIALPLLVGMFTVIPATHWLAAGSEFRPAAWPLVWLDGFYHLWFLWYLLLLAGGFMLAARLGLQFRRRLWWLLVPLTLLPQYFNRESFGADTPTGPLPEPAIIGLYAVFFAFGVFFYRRGLAPRRWWTAGIPLALFIFPVGVAFSHPDGAQTTAAEALWWLVGAALLKAAYAWLMAFGMMGLFRWAMARERFRVRYMSDASYWMYIAHLPLVIAGQRLAASWSANPHLAFALILVGVTVILLPAYQAGVRYTPIGTMLNGKRARRSAPPAAQPTSV